MAAILTLVIDAERDVVLARQRARQLAELIGFDVQDQTRIATAVSEIARNAFRYAGGGKAEFRLEGTTPPQVLMVTITDRGRGIADLQAVLDGRYLSETGMGLGIVGARRLMDGFDIATTPGEGTSVVLKKVLPKRVGLLDGSALGRIAHALVGGQPRDPLEEVQQQNQELLRALDELARRQEELTALNGELEDTNRGVVALYAELDERADHLRRADEIKSRFLSNMSHEFRTPVNSIQALARLLLDETDGPLTEEQRKQVVFIRGAAEGLSELVNDLLDLAKVEAGKIVVRPVEFEIANLFGALRGMLRPLLVNDSVNLVFEEPGDLPMLHTDEAKVSQILRNFISNALKYTEQGEVRVWARALPDEDAIAFSVADTGIGIAPEDQERIFEEFAQVEHPLQRRVKGTGLGLPLCRRLAGLLGGRLTVESAVGRGSVFTAVIPVSYGAPPSALPVWDLDPTRVPVLIVENSPEMLHLYARFLAGSPFQALHARTLREARDALAVVRPQAIVLDILLSGEEGWELLTEVKRSATPLPVLVLTTVDDEPKARALGADAYCLKPIDRHRLVDTLTRITQPRDLRRVLMIDDEETARYVFRQLLASSARYAVLEASSGAEGIRLARSEQPHVICLDLVMPGDDGRSVLHRLKGDASTRDIPVVVVTSKRLDEPERQRLLQDAVAILPKEDLTVERTVATIENALRTAERTA